MFSSLKKLTGTALAVVMISSPVFAAEITPEGAAQLKTLIQTQIDLRKNVQSAAGGQYITEGELKVEPTDSYYAVTLPHIKMKDAAGKVFDIGMVAANVIPGANDKEWKAAIAIPTPIRIIGADNKQVGEISIATQRALGVWDTDLSSFIRLDAQYTDIAFKSDESPAGFKIGTASFKNQLSRESNGHLSGPAQAILQNWTLESPDDKLTGSIKSLNIDVAVKDFDPLVAKSFNEQIGAIGQAGQKITDSAISAQGGMAMYNMMTNLMGKSSDSFSVAMSMDGLAITGPNETTQVMETFELGKVALGFDMSGFRAGAVKTGLKVGYTDLKLNDPNDAYKDIIPLTANVNLTVNNLPFQQLVDLGRDTMAANSGNPQAAQMAGMTAMATVPKLLTDAGTTLEQSFDFAANTYQGKGSGVLAANMKAISGFTAEQNAEFTGLDKVIAKIHEEMAKPGNVEAQALQSVLGPLTIMQMVGQQKPDAPDTRTYHLTVDETGKTMLNGSDLSTIMGMGGGAPQPGPATDMSVPPGAEGPSAGEEAPPSATE